MRFSGRLRRGLIGDRAFYGAAMTIVMPIIIQNSVTNLVNLLDNIMVGQLGTAQLSGVAIVNQMMFVYNLGIFGGISGPGIFGAQFFGAGDLEGFRNAFRVKLWVCAAILLAALLAFIGFDKPLVSVFLTGKGDPMLAEDTLYYAGRYLRVMLAGLLPFALTQVYASTLRETGETMVPMKAGIVSVLVNLLGNWLLIGGNLGFPALGVDGAALATVLSRFVEVAIIIAAVHRGRRHDFMHGAFHSLRVPASLLRAMAKRGLPLLVNEWLWALGMATLTQIYSVRGLTVLAAMNIASTIAGMFNVVFISMGNAVAVMVGQLLGAGELRRARTDAWRLIFFNFSLSVAIGALMALASGAFPRFYNTTAEVKEMAARFIFVGAVFMPIYSIAHSSYFTLRSGGSTFMTLLFDSAFNWVVVIPYTLFLVHRTNLDIMALYPLSQFSMLLKSALGLGFVRSGIWLRNITRSHENG